MAPPIEGFLKSPPALFAPLPPRREHPARRQEAEMRFFPLALALQAAWASLCQAAMQHYPAAWGHYDVCKSQVYTDEGLTWDYMACQPEAADMTKYLKVSVDPPNVTCGDPPETYCALVSGDPERVSMPFHPRPSSSRAVVRSQAVTENPYMCNNECDAATEELAHPPRLMFDFEGRNPTTFWQSTSWKKYPKALLVNITLSWNKTIELTDDIVVTFESGRPEQMVLEKSLDYGRSWQPYQFYATDCLDAFTMEPKTVQDLTQHTLLDIICTEDYSRGYVWKYDKTVRFEIKDRFALFAGPRLHNMASLYGQLDTTKNLRDFFTVTDLRVRLLRPATGATIVDENNLSRYFYAISDIKVQGSSGDSGRSSRRIDLNSGAALSRPGVTRQRCRCDASVRGPSRRVETGHGDMSSVWAGNCECFGHSNRCIYIDSINTVICVSCKHNTRGQHCQLCKLGYYRNASAEPNDVNGCIARVCDNELLRCQNGGVCHNNLRCHCTPDFTGLLCEKRRCENELGGCGGLDSGQAALSPPSLPGLLLLLLGMALREAPWAGML
ncbi:netrin-G1-like [Osmerus mordax]|uniref:netrin-G1-like n=1 Tax=Osmerus mordax TaxID=8014 RepID=UPI00350FBC7E